MAAHTVLLRELLILFAGNEFSVGVIIGSWIVAEAGGAVATGHQQRLPSPGRARAGVGPDHHPAPTGAQGRSPRRRMV